MYLTEQIKLETGQRMKIDFVSKNLEGNFNSIVWKMEDVNNITISAPIKDKTLIPIEKGDTFFAHLMEPYYGEIIIIKVKKVYKDYPLLLVSREKVEEITPIQLIEPLDFNQEIEMNFTVLGYWVTVRSKVLNLTDEGIIIEAPTIDGTFARVEEGLELTIFYMADIAKYLFKSILKVIKKQPSASKDKESQVWLIEYPERTEIIARRYPRVRFMFNEDLEAWEEKELSSDNLFVTRLSPTAFYAKIQDISESGLKLMASHPLKEGSSLVIQFNLPNTEDAVKAKGKIVRIRKILEAGGVEKYEGGVAFTLLKETDRLRIRDLTKETNTKQ